MVSATTPSWGCAAAGWVSLSWSIPGSDPGLGASSATPCAKPCPSNTGQVDSVEMNENPGEFHPCPEIPRILGNDVKTQQYPGDSQQALTAYSSTLVCLEALFGSSLSSFLLQIAFPDGFVDARSIKSGLCPFQCLSELLDAGDPL